MYTITFDEKLEYKKENLKLNAEEEMLWDYFTEVEKMHVFPIEYDYGLFVFYGDSSNYESAEVFSRWEYFIDTLKPYMDKAKKYAEEKKKKEYCIELVKYGTIHFYGTEEEACALANKLQSDSRGVENKFTEDEFGVGWDNTYIDIYNIEGM